MTTAMKKKVRIIMLDQKRLALTNLDRDDPTVDNRIRSIPQRFYSAPHRHWVVPFSDENIEFIRSRFDVDEIEATDEAALVLEYISLRSQQASKKERRRWEYLFEDKIPEIAYEPYTEPFKHQTVCLDAVHGSEFFGIFMEMGTGKTKVLLDEIRWCMMERIQRAAEVGMPVKSLRVLIGCPSGVMHTWKKEMAKHWPPDFDYHCEILSLLPKAADEMVAMAQTNAKCKIFVCSFDRISILFDFLKEWNFDIFALDESARIKNPFAKRSGACIELGRFCSRRIIMTGSPVLNNVFDLYAQFEFLSEGLLGFSSFNAFKNYHAKVESYNGYEVVRQFKNLEELKAKVAKYSFVVKKEQCLDLPDKVYETVEVEMSEKQAEMYEQMLTWLVAALDASNVTESNSVKAQAMIAQLVKLRQICCGFFKNADGDCIDIPGATGKTEQLLDDIEEVIDNDGKALVWAAFKHDIVRIKRALEKNNIGFVEIHGSVKQKDRNVAEDRFNEDDSIRVMVAEPGTAGEGKTLLGDKRLRCSTSIFYSSDFSLGKRIQAEDRNHRIGQDRVVIYKDYIAFNTIEEKIVEALKAKKDLASYMTSMADIKDLLMGPAGLLAGRK